VPRPDFVSARRKTTANWPVPLRTAARSNSRRTGYADSEVHLLLDGLLLFEINQQPVAEAGPGAIFDPAIRTRTRGVAAGSGTRKMDDAKRGNVKRKYGGGAAAQPDADGGTACLAHIARTGAPRGAAPPHSVTIQACRNMYKS
jgi:hypothetical protein